MNPTMSSTAAGSRITVYFPAGISRGCAESAAFFAATLGQHQRIELRSHPANSPSAIRMNPRASIVIETSADGLRMPLAQSA